MTRKLSGSIPLLKGFLMIGAACLLSACASSTPQWDSLFGNSTRSAISQQTLNPDAAQNRNPVSGVDGRAAQDSMDRYHKSFQQPEPQTNVFTIGIGGSGGSSVGK